MPEIPKIIHYIWVGGKPLTPLAERCLASWKKYLPDYEIKLWNEKNSPMDHHYVKVMYDKSKWAFVSDYIRFWALNNEGGIYLDTDMEILKPLDTLLTEEGFVGKSKSGQIESSIVAAASSADFIKKALEFYDNDREYSVTNTSPIVLSHAIADTSSKVTVYHYSHFFPCDEGEKCTDASLKDSFARHHWAESWVTFARTRKFLRRLGVMELIKKVLK
jgi:mannosyltransferase OCH1-like enzyme